MIALSNILKNILKNKYIMFGLIIIGLVSYYEIQRYSYKADILELKEKIVDNNKDYIELNKKYVTSQMNLNKAVNLSNSNSASYKEFQRDCDKSIKSNSLIFIDKDKQIKRLIKTIKNLRKSSKHEIKKFILVKDCKLYEGDINETNKINTIGF